MRETNPGGHDDGVSSSELLEGDAFFDEFDTITETLEHGIPVSEARMDRIVRSGIVIISQAMSAFADSYFAEGA